MQSPTFEEHVNQLAKKYSIVWAELLRQALKNQEEVD